MSPSLLIPTPSAPGDPLPRHVAWGRAGHLRQRDNRAVSFLPPASYKILLKTKQKLKPSKVILNSPTLPRPCSSLPHSSHPNSKQCSRADQPANPLQPTLSALHSGRRYQNFLSQQRALRSSHCLQSKVCFSTEAERPRKLVWLVCWAGGSTRIRLN